jgi:hypothetical protein
LTNAPHETYTIFRDESFSIDEEQIPPPEVGEAYSDYLIRIVEEEDATALNYNSTLMESSLFPNAVPGRDSGWFVYNNANTSAVKVTNSLPDPITIIKRDAENPSKVLTGVEFDLHKVSLDADGTPNYGSTQLLAGGLTTNQSGRIILNTPGNQQLEKGLLYKLVEQGSSGKDIYFWMTDSLLPKVRKVYQLDAGGYEIEFNARDSDGKLITSAFGTEDGLTINIYNNVAPIAKSSIVVEKAINAAQEDFSDGDLNFLFKLEKLDGNGDVVEEWVKPATIASGSVSPPVEFDGLDVGFKYRISELKSIRYEVEEIEIALGTYDTLENENTSLNNSDNQPVILLGEEGLAPSVVQFDNDNVFDKRMSSSALKVNQVSMPVSEEGGNEIETTKPNVVEIEFIKVIRKRQQYAGLYDFIYFYERNQKNLFIIEGDSVDATGNVEHSEYANSRFVLLPTSISTHDFYGTTALACLTTYQPLGHSYAGAGLGPMLFAGGSGDLTCYYPNAETDYEGWLSMYSSQYFGGATEALTSTTSIQGDGDKKRYVVYRAEQSGSGEEWWKWE